MVFIHENKKITEEFILSLLVLTLLFDSCQILNVKSFKTIAGAPTTVFQHSYIPLNSTISREGFLGSERAYPFRFGNVTNRRDRTNNYLNKI